MLKNVLCCMVISVLSAGCCGVKSEKCCALSKPECKKTDKMLRHVVILKFKDDVTPEQIKEVEDAFTSLPGKISVIKCFEWGTNVSKENRSDGFTHCFVLSFLCEEDRDTYLNHPDHKAFGKTLGPYLYKVRVIDYWATHQTNGG